MQHHSSEDDHGMAVIPDHDCDNYHGPIMKETDTHKLRFAPDHDHDSDHDLVVTQHHGCSLGHGQVVTISEVQRHTCRSHHNHDGPRKAKTTYFEDFAVVSMSKLTS